MRKVLKIWILIKTTEIILIVKILSNTNNNNELKKNWAPKSRFQEIKTATQFMSIIRKLNESNSKWIKLNKIILRLFLRLRIISFRDNIFWSGRVMRHNLYQKKKIYSSISL